MKLRAFTLAIALILPALPAYADAVLTLDHGTAWLTQKPDEDSQGFLQIHNTGDVTDTLTSVDCTIADSTELVDASGAPLKTLDIAPGATVTLSAKGPHLLLKDARYAMAKDAILPCAFRFTQSGNVIGFLNVIKKPRH